MRDSLIFSMKLFGGWLEMPDEVLGCGDEGRERLRDDGGGGED